MVYWDAICDVSQVEMECTDSDEDKPEEKRDEQVWWHQFACLCGSGRKREILLWSRI